MSGVRHRAWLKERLAWSGSRTHRDEIGRELRIHDPGGIYHVTSHGVDDLPIVRDDHDRLDFLFRLGRVVRRLDWRLYSFCLLDTHFHLLVSLREPNLSDGMRVVNGAHSREFNARHGRRGALFEKRYGDEPVQSDRHLLSTIRYIALNPVEAGLVDRPADWRWSSYADLIDVRRDWSFVATPFVRAHFAPPKSDAIRIIRAFVEAATPRDATRR